jgi:hypothetical protein
MTPTINLADVIAYVESRGDSFALRFEPATYTALTTGAMTPEHADIVSAIATIHNCSVPTAQVIYSSSWGRFQIMGFNLYGPTIQLKTTVFAYCADDIAQIAAFDALVTSMGLGGETAPMLATDPQARIAFGAKYNGNGPAYANEIAVACVHFGLQVNG